MHFKMEHRKLINWAKALLNLFINSRDLKASAIENHLKWTLVQRDNLKCTLIIVVIIWHVIFS